jgi:hypothetical protein
MGVIDRMAILLATLFAAAALFGVFIVAFDLNTSQPSGSKQGDGPASESRPAPRWGCRSKALFLRSLDILNQKDTVAFGELFDPPDFVVAFSGTGRVKVRYTTQSLTVRFGEGAVRILLG